MKRTNQKGITLIALIVTIIVLIIIAGISIATLTADNGILRQTNSAKVAQIEGNAREQLQLAMSAMRLAIAEAQAQDNSYKASQNAGKIQAKLVEILNADIEGLNGTFDFGGNDLADTASSAEITIGYTGEDYQNACNDDNAKITYTIGLGQKTIELIGEAATGITGSDGVDTNLNIGGSSYLVDNVEIGDYVDIGINYTNTLTYVKSNVMGTYGESGPTGWRVLSKSGKGSTGTVTLVTAGIPLRFYHPSDLDAESSITLLNNLNAEISLVALGEHGFYRNSFGSNDLRTIWSENQYINQSSGVHAMTTNELMHAYNILTKQNKTITDIWATNSSENSCRTSIMLSKNPNISTNEYDLLANGMMYWLGESEFSENALWVIYGGGGVDDYDYASDDALGVRPVVTLKSGIKIAEDNVGTGLYGSDITLAD